jgi:hypothetical protein
MNDLYQTRYIALITQSKTPSIKPKRHYPIYMNKVSTEGILDDNMKFWTLLELRRANIKWQETKGE